MRHTFFKSKIGIAFVVFVLSASIIIYLERMPVFITAVIAFLRNLPEILAAIIVFFMENGTGLIAFAAFGVSLLVACYNRKLNYGIHLLQLKNAFWEKERHKVHKKIISRYNNRDFFTGEEPKSVGGEKQEHSDNFVDESMVDEYMGLFESLYILYKNGGLHKKHIINMYRYRIEEMLENENIVRKLIEDHEYWQSFYELVAIVKKDKKWKELYKVLGKFKSEKNVMSAIQLKQFEDSIGERLCNQIAKYLEKNRFS